MYVANAGDSRGVLVRNGRSHPMSHDFTPESERQRVRRLVRIFYLLLCFMSKLYLLNM
jgi:serine/threonine protein phosphatase PrpC